MSSSAIPDEFSLLSDEEAVSQLSENDSRFATLLRKLKRKKSKGLSAQLEHEGNVDEARRKQFGQYESYNYDVIENRLYDQRQENITTEDQAFESLVRWMLCGIIGLCTGLVGLFVHVGTKKIEDWKFGVSGYLVEEKGTFWEPFLLYVGLNCCFVLVASLLATYVEPQAKGSGIPEVKSLLNGNHVPRVVRLRTLVSKSVGIMFSVAGGLFVGKEGPMVHSGAIVASGISQGRGETTSWNTRWLRRTLRSFRNDKDKRDFISTGAATGVAAAFGAPIGGLLFSFEEASTHWDQSQTWRTFFATMVCTSTMNFFLGSVWDFEHFGEMSRSTLVSFGSFEGPSRPDDEAYADVQGYTFWELPLFMLLGVFGGATGALFNAANTRISRMRMRVVNKPFLRVCEAIAIAALTAAFTFVVPYYWPCTPYPPDADFMKPAEMYCEEGTFSELGTLMFSSLSSGVRHFFHSSWDFSLGALGTFTVSYYVIACVTYGISIPSGLFVPSIIVGSSYGRFFGQLLKMYVGDRISPGYYALIGAASFLGGLSRMTVSIVVIIIEATNNLSYGIPIMIAVMMAKLVGDRFNEGLYDIHVKLKCVPFLEAQPIGEMRQLRAKQIMAKKVHTFCEVESVDNIVTVLTQTKHNGFPVVRKDADNPHLPGIFLGLITRQQLCVLLKKRKFGPKMTPAYNTDTSSIDYEREDELLPWEAFACAYPHFPVIHELDISEGDRQMYMDLSPYMNHGGYTIHQGVKAARVFRMMRNLGIRHLTVVDVHNHVQGMITRKDLMPWTTYDAVRKEIELEKQEVQHYLRRKASLDA